MNNLYKISILESTKGIFIGTKESCEKVLQKRNEAKPNEDWLYQVHKASVEEVEEYLEQISKTI